MAKIYPYIQYKRKIICKDCGCINKKTINYNPRKHNYFLCCPECEGLDTIVSYSKREREKH